MRRVIRHSEPWGRTRQGDASRPAGTAELTAEPLGRLVIGQFIAHTSQPRGILCIAQGRMGHVSRSFSCLWTTVLRSQCTAKGYGNVANFCPHPLLDPTECQPAIYQDQLAVVDAARPCRTQLRINSVEDVRGTWCRGNQERDQRRGTSGIYWHQRALVG